MITNAEKKAALKAISFNLQKALRLFCFCFASFCVGLSVLYWSLNYQYGNLLEESQQQLIQDLDNLEHHLSVHSVSSLYEGVVEFQGLADFDEVKVIEGRPESYDKDEQLIRVRGQKREVAPAVFELRFSPVK